MAASNGRVTSARFIVRRCRSVPRIAAFRARGFPELERHAARVGWSTLLRPGTRVQLRVTSRKSRLYHEGAIAERLARVLADRAGLIMAAAPHDDAGDVAHDDVGDVAGDDERADAVLIIVRVLRDEFTISVDASGRLLHQRGYRRAIAMAPLRETLAAAVLLGSRWDPATPLIDPFCGSGTIPIEAALIARRIPPGLAAPGFPARDHALERWASFDATLWQDVVDVARREIRDRAPAAIIAADRNGGAIGAARANAERAGVAADIELRHAALARLEAPAGTGALVTNPPYGVRVGERRQLAGLYAELGGIARQRLPGWTVALLSADPRAAAAAQLPFEERLATRNGGLDVRLLAAHVPTG
jgi:putative N6-adenine-specific DNA methylase